MIAPSRILPEFSTLDGLEDIIISWKSNVMTQYGYQIQFFNNATDALLFDTGLVVSVLTSYTLPAGSLANNLEIKYYIKQYESAISNIDSEYILIRTAAKPTAVVPSVPSSTQSYEFTANVTLATGVTIQKYKFTLYDSFNTEIFSTGYIYDYVPRATIEGLLPDFQYKVDVEIVDSENQMVQSAKVPFTITASSSSLDLFTITGNDSNASVKIEFVPINQTLGTVSGSYSYVDGKFGLGLNLSAGGYVEFVKDIPDTYSISFYKKLPVGFVGDLVTLGDDEYTVFYNGSRFGYRIGDFMTVGKLRSMPSDSFIKIIIKYGKILIQTVNYTEII
jgi:hypothetical protein